LELKAQIHELKEEILHRPNDEEVGDNGGFWRIWKFECDDCMIAKKSWPNYVKKTEALFGFFPILVNSLDAINHLSSENIIWPSQMAKAIDFNKKVKLENFWCGNSSSTT
jgi:hypothetical protein